MIAEMRINGKPTEPEILKETANGLSCKGTIACVKTASRSERLKLFKIRLS